MQLRAIASGACVAMMLFFGCGGDGGSGGGSGGASGGGGGRSGTGGGAVAGTGGRPGTGGAAAGSGGAGAGTGGSGVGGASSGPVQVLAACPFTACGGAVANTTWGYTGACITEASLLAGVRAVCAGVTLTEATGTVSGSLAFAGNQVNQQGTLSLTAVVSVPASCSPGGCGVAMTALNLQFPGSTCTGADPCRCTVPITQTLARAGAYTTAGNTLTSAGTTYQYCIDDSALQHTSGGTGPQFVYQTTRR